MLLTPELDAGVFVCVGEGNRLVLWGAKDIGRLLSLLFVGLSLGLLLSVGWQTAAQRNAGAAGSPSGQFLLSVQRLEAEQQALKTTLAELRQELAHRQQAVASQSERLQVLEIELARQQLLASLTPVQGPGVIVTLDDSPAQVPPSVDANLYLIHEYDLRDVVNLLWIAGSEAIAINSERLTSFSSVYCVGSTVMVNDTRLAPPYLIQAIGNPRVQQDYLRNPSHLKELKEKQRLYGVRFEVREVANLTLPAYSGSFLIRHAKPGD